MNLFTLTVFGAAVFLFLFLIMVFAFRRTEDKAAYRLLLAVFFITVLFLSWQTEDFALQWVFIEASSMISALLVSMSRTEKSVVVAWRFLLLNSFGLGLAFLGLVILSYGDKSSLSMGFTDLLNGVKTGHNTFIEAGIWLAVFGFSAKLGLFPNHFWVSDTYAESPSPVSALISAFVSSSVCLILRNLLKLDMAMQNPHFISGKGLLIMGFITMLYSILTSQQTKDIRRLAAQSALFHSGVLGVILYLNLPDDVFYFALAANIASKSLTFSSLGIFRVDAGSRDIPVIRDLPALNRYSTGMLLAGLCMAFIVPVSPVFLSDMMIIKEGAARGAYWILVLPFLGLVQFLVIFYKIYPFLDIRHRPFPESEKSMLMKRMVLTGILFFLSLGLGCFGFTFFPDLWSLR